ncbi:MAG TPA: hypothetical protein VFU43_01645 [Streptosporangiaceae bacterium]|nr:hypothetical protein [Streptosporangiaceae bacterium]
MLDLVRSLAGLELSPESYLEDFWPHFREVKDVLWKLERIQDFREPDEPSWLAMTEGDWERALALIEKKRGESQQQAKSSEGFANRRLRIVEQPVTPYLQWEMHILKIRVETGEQEIKVLDAHAVRQLEAQQPLPELLVLGTSALYEVLYDETGVLSGARRIDDLKVIDACRQELAELFDEGEDLLAYFEREIEPLPRPNISN